MKKSDLKTGMLVVTRNGAHSLVLCGTPQGDVFASNLEENSDVVTKKTWMMFDTIDDNLLCSFDHRDADIMEVWGYSSNMLGASLGLRDRKLLWKRSKSTVKLNDTYEATVDKDTKTITVGCQTFSFDVVEKLLNAIKP